MRCLVLVVALLSHVAMSVSGQTVAADSASTDSAVTGAAAPRRPLTDADRRAWNVIASPQLSHDGAWFAYIVASERAGSAVVLRRLADGHELRFAFTGVPDSAINFSEDSRWVAWSEVVSSGSGINADRREAGGRVSVVKLSDGVPTVFENVVGYSFGGRPTSWLAVLHGSDGQPNAAAANLGRLLELRDLVTGSVAHLENVYEFIFDAQGTRLFWSTEGTAGAQASLVLRDLKSGAQRTLDSTLAAYRHLAWDEYAGGLLSVLRTHADALEADTNAAIVWFTPVGTVRAVPRKQEYLPLRDPAFPDTMKLDGGVRPRFTVDRAGVYFFTRPLADSIVFPRILGDAPVGARWLQEGPADGAHAAALSLPGVSRSAVVQPQLTVWRQPGNLSAAARSSKRAESAFRRVLMFHGGRQRMLVALDSGDYRFIAAGARDRWGLLESAGPGHSVGIGLPDVARDVQSVDLRDGTRRSVLKGVAGPLMLSPDGQLFAFHSGGHYYVNDIASGNSRNITENIATSFEDSGNDLTGALPATPFLGWSADSRSVLLSDGWDVWNVQVNGRGATNLTVNGRTDSLRYGPPLPGPGTEPYGDSATLALDLRRPMHLMVREQWTKREGVARVLASRPGAAILLWEEAHLQLLRARDAEVHVYSRETVAEFPDWFAVNGPLQKGVRVTRANQLQDEVEWPGGARLIDYQHPDGKRLQAALYLPSGYEPGKSYPTVVIVGARIDGIPGERQSGLLHRYHTASGAMALNPSLYAGRGYAVLLPDIVFRANEPGVSALDCVQPAVDAAIALGIVDANRVGLYGEGWGGYESAFIATRGAGFRAIVAASPLTNLLAAGGSDAGGYRNPGSVLSEASRGRISSDVWSNSEALFRNSPAMHAAGVQAPILLQYDDASGYSSAGQAMEFLSALHGLGKAAAFLHYSSGDADGLARANREDFAARVRAFFDHLLLGSAAPNWWSAAQLFQSQSPGRPAIRPTR
jgi:dienelactone hydrolase